MKKKRLIMIIVVIIVSLILTFSGCDFLGNTATATLDVPTNLRIDRTMAKWNPVDGSGGYIVSIDGNEYACNNAQYDLTTVNELVGGETYIIKVKAVGDGIMKKSSDFSAGVEFTYVPKTTPGGKDEKPYTPPSTTDPTTKDVVDVLFESGLGYGVNAITASSAVGGARLSSIFDQAKLTSANIGSYSIGSSRATATSKENITDEVSAYNSKLVLSSSANASALGGMFTAGFEMKFSLSNAVKFRKACKAILLHTEPICQRQKLSIKGIYTEARLFGTAIRRSPKRFGSRKEWRYDCR
jgi:hypothetical protein